MTVKELREYLKQFPDDMNVVYPSRHSIHFYEFAPEITIYVEKLEQDAKAKSLFKTPESEESQNAIKCLVID